MAKKFFYLCAGILMLAGTHPASSVFAEPDLLLSTASMEYSGSEPAVMFNVPSGSGSAFTEARVLEGQVDATITLCLVDGAGVPISDYPAEDLCLFCLDWGYPPSPLPTCSNGAIADSPTDALGMTTWVNPLRSGGYGNRGTKVLVGGNPLLSGDLNLYHNSPDIDGDLVVNLNDVAMFTVAYFSQYGFDFVIDFHYDGVINLLDVALMAQSIGAYCWQNP